MRGTTAATLLALTMLTAAAGLGCNSSPTQPSGKALEDAQNAAQKQADGEERQYQSESKKAAGKK